MGKLHGKLQYNELGLELVLLGVASIARSAKDIFFFEGVLLSYEKKHSMNTGPVFTRMS